MAGPGAELRQRADGAAPQHGVDGGLAEVPVPRAQQPHRAVHRVDGPPRRLVQQRLEQGCEEVPWTTVSLVSNNKLARDHGRCVIVHAWGRDGTGRKRTGPLRVRDSGDEGEQARAAEELGDEHGGVALRLGGVDPLEAGAQHAGLAAAFAQHPAPVAAHAATVVTAPPS